MLWIDWHLKAVHIAERCDLARDGLGHEVRDRLAYLVQIAQDIDAFPTTGPDAFGDDFKG